MKSRLLLLFVGLISFSLHSQRFKPLSLQQAVMESRTIYAVQDIDDLQWIPGTDQYSYMVDKGADVFIMRGYLDDRPDEEITSFGRMKNGMLNGGYVTPDEMPSMTWAPDGVVLRFAYKGQSWEYNTQLHTIKRSVTTTRLALNKDLSPDGRIGVMTIGNDLYWCDETRDSIRITTVEGEKVTAGHAVHRYEFGITKGTFWSPNSDKVAFYINDQTDVTEYPIVNYYGTPAVEDPIIYPMAGQQSEKVSVFIYDLATFSAVRIDTGEPSEDYLTNITWSPDGAHLFISHLNRGQDHLRLVKYDVLTGAPVATLIEERHEKYVEPEHGLYFLEGTKGEFLFWSERDGYDHLYRYDAKGKLLNQVTSGPHVMLEIEHYDPTTKEIFVTGTGKSVDRVLYMGSVQDDKMTAVSSTEGTHRVQVNKKTGHYIDSYSSVRVPRRITIHDREGKEIKTLLNAKDPLRANEVGSTEILTVKADDGTELFARMIKPSDFDPSKKYPVLVYVYGGPHAQMVSDRWLAGAPLWMHHAVERGMILFTLDGRGSSNRGRDFEQAVFENLGDLEMADQLAGVDYLKTLPYVDADRLAVHGWSFGGFMTNTLMLRSPGTFKVGVAGGSVTDWSMYEVMYTERYMNTPEENPTGYDKARLYPLAPNLEGDLLLIHGTSDDVVVMQHTMVLLNGFINAGKQVDFFVYPGHMHNVRGQDRVHLMTKVLDYVQEKLDF